MTHPNLFLYLSKPPASQFAMGLTSTCLVILTVRTEEEQSFSKASSPLSAVKAATSRILTAMELRTAPISAKIASWEGKWLITRTLRRSNGRNSCFP